MSLVLFDWTMLTLRERQSLSLSVFTCLTPDSQLALLEVKACTDAAYSWICGYFVHGFKNLHKWQ